MKPKSFDAVEMKRLLQEEAEKKLSDLSDEEQLRFLKKKFGYLRKKQNRTGIVDNRK